MERIITSTIVNGLSEAVNHDSTDIESNKPNNAAHTSGVNLAARKKLTVHPKENSIRPPGGKHQVHIVNQLIRYPATS